MSLPNNLSLQDQPKLDSNFTKGRFANQVLAQCRNAIFFPTTQILREINFCKPRVSKSAILTVLAPMKFGLSEFMHFVRA